MVLSHHRRTLLVSDAELAEVSQPQSSSLRRQTKASLRADRRTHSRLSHIARVVSAQAQALLERHARGEAAGVADGELWEAKRLKDAVIHPVTGEGAEHRESEREPFPSYASSQRCRHPPRHG